MTSQYPPVALPEVPFAEEVQTLCLSLEGAWEDYPWGSIFYRVGTKRFAWIGSEAGHLSVTVRAKPQDVDVLTQFPFISPSRYSARHGWITVELVDTSAFDLARDLIVESYQLVRAGPRSAAKARE